MSNRFGNAIFQLGICSAPSVDNHCRVHCGISGGTSVVVPSCSRSDNVRYKRRGLSFSNNCPGRNLCKTSPKLSQNIYPAFSMITRSVLAVDPASEIRKFNLDGSSELQIAVSVPNLGSSCVDIEVTNVTGSLVLHWGVIHKKKKGWFLPSQRPDGTSVYNNQALRTPFIKDASNASLQITVNDPEIEAIEFVVLDETLNKWYKNNGLNFCVQLLSKASENLNVSVFQSSDVSLPEDLVQLFAYLRWERKGRQSYTQEQEKVEYEAARSELLQEIFKGTTIEELRAKIKKNTEGVSEESSRKSPVGVDIIPDELVQVQAYIRWEKAGKPNYSSEKQLMEFEEARKELQYELEQGTPIEKIKEKILKGNIQTKVSKQLKDKNYFTVEKIQRKRRDIMQLLCKHSSETIGEEVNRLQEVPNDLELYSKVIVEQDGSVVNRKRFKLADRELMVIVVNSPVRTKIYLATDHAEPLILHWSLSKKSREWMVPPSGCIPPGSVLMEKSCETPFSVATSSDPPYKLQTILIDVPEHEFHGLLFVLRADGYWIKDADSDFYVEFSGATSKIKDAVDARGIAKNLLEKIAEMETDAQRSLMHRFNVAADLMEEARAAGMLGLAGILVWMRFMATRQLVWNKNYNVKPREISKAQDRLTDILQDVYCKYPQYTEILRIILATVGRGGEGDVGQRIRDEILVIQRKNDCKGGMMEEWHQKLHNNTSPDDVVICQALIDYIESDFEISAYWNTLNKNGITKERLLSYDRAIHSEPSFRREQKEGLLRDLGNYLRTLKAVHSGADLESAIATCLGYNTEGEGFMVGVKINPVRGLPAGFPELLEFIIDHIEVKAVEPLLEGILEARQELRPLLVNNHERLKDLIFLDIALDSGVRSVVERAYEELNDAKLEKMIYFISVVLENLVLSSNNNEDLLYCSKGWSSVMEMYNKSDEWALYAKSVLDRTRLALSSKAEVYHQILQPSAKYLGALLRVDEWAVTIFTEEIIRGSSAASLSLLLNRLDPFLRSVAHLGSWQVISPVEVSGYITVVDELLAVQNISYEKPTILVARRVKGEEEIPDGAVAVLTPDMPDVLSHVSVRARNSKVCFATCFDPDILFQLQQKEGKLFQLKPNNADIIYSEMKDGELTSAISLESEGNQSSPIVLARKHFAGRYAISAAEFSNETVGAKSRNISYLKGKVPPWVGIPISIALPFGVFETVVSEDINHEVAEDLLKLKEKLRGGDFSVLSQIRKAVLQLLPPPQLVMELEEEMKKAGMPWPGDEGEQRWEMAWTAIKKVWASKWNERAYFSTHKAKLDHDNLCMAVLVQEIISADYAFVIHTTNPSSGDSSEIYVEVVRGLGETLVGAFPGRALSFVCKKSQIDSPRILGYPSKPIGLFIRRSIIFRSDSNGEDLEGYAGAGLYDSVPMDEEEKVVLDYTNDPLITDPGFRRTILSGIARAGYEIEQLYGSPQDVEGVVKDGKVFVVQTRPQM